MRELFKKLILRGVRFIPERGDLRILLGNATLSKGELQSLKASKKAIIRTIQGRKVACLSPAQERLWFLAQLGESEQYHIPYLVRFKGHLHKPALIEAVNFVVARHESLRTCFMEMDGMGFQAIEASVELPLQRHQLKEFSPSRKSRQLQTLLKRFVYTPFQLQQAPLVRALLVELTSNETIFGLCFHHLVCDGWSMRVLSQELSHAYRSFADHREPHLEPQKLQYNDYAVWQRQVWDDTKMERDLAYWREHLWQYRDLELVTDFPRPKQLSGKGASIFWTLSELDATGLKNQCRDQKITFFAALMTSVYLVLQYHSGQSDICLGMPVANRNQKGTETMIGFMVDTLVARIASNSRGSETLAELLQRVHLEIVAAQERRNIPFEKIAEIVQARRNLSRTPIFQVLVNFFDFAPEEQVFGDCSMERMGSDYQSSKFDLTFGFSNGPDGCLKIGLGYSVDLYCQETIKGMGNHLKGVLESLVTNPSLRTDRLDWLSENEKKLLLGDWNQTKCEQPGPRTLHQCFANRARQTPDQVGLIHQNQFLTCARLEMESQLLAYKLRRLGVGLESLIGIAMERSLELLVGIFGVLKAGAGYVPLDPGNPDGRLSYMIDDSGLGLILTQEKFHTRMQALFPSCPESVVVPDLGGKAHVDKTPVIGACAFQLAYVIYTSGSTGNPKGVMIAHCNVVNTLWALERRFPLGPQDAYLLKTNMAFDVSVTELFAWVFGQGCLVILPPGAEKSPSQILDHIARQEVTHINFVPSLLQTFLATLPGGESGKLHKVRHLMVAGEAFPTALLKQALSFFQPNVIENIYGPTEASIYASVYSCSREEGLKGTVLPIGKPLSNTQMYILDKRLEPVSVGVVGELYLAGAGVARGYLNRKKLTLERFIASPFETGGRLYRTGDMARWMSDGNVAYLGRSDHQVKIRGFRIECGEIENRLTKHSGVQSAAVVVRARKGDQQLVAYCVKAGKDTPVDEPALRAFLSLGLPDYMLPTAIVFLDRLPLTSGGKIDRRDLVGREVVLVSRAQYVAPRSRHEQRLAEIWGEVLGQKRVGIHDNFFELGGHSLLAMQIISRIKRDLGSEIGLRSLFESPTIARLCKHMGKGTQTQPIVQQQRPRELPLSNAQERLWFLAQLGLSGQYHIPKILKIIGTLDVQALQNSLDYLIARHESLRTKFGSTRGRTHQEIVENVTLNPLQIDLSCLNEATRLKACQRVLFDFIHQSFELEHAPLMRVVLVTWSESTQFLVLCLHHIIADGRSMAILLRELGQAYRQFVNGEAPPMVDLGLQYVDYALWQRETLTDLYLETGLAFWREELKGYEDLNIQTDWQRPGILSGYGRHLRFELKAQEHADLGSLVRSHEVTKFSFLLACVYLLLRRYCGQSDICIGVPVANRNRAELEDLVGLFVNTVVIRVRPLDELSLLDLIKEIHGTVLAALDHQEIPFEKMIDQVAERRDQRRSPIFQVAVNYGETEAEEPKLSFQGRVGNVAGSPLPIALDYCISKFELTVGFIEKGEGLLVSLEYSSDLFEKATIRRMANHLNGLLDQLSDLLDHPITELPLLDEAEKQKLLLEWNDTAATYDRNQTLHGWFEMQAESHPQKVAVVFESIQLTYGDLNQRADVLGFWLRKKGVKPDGLVGICVHRGLEMIVAMLGVLKSGGAYIPLDPNTPPARLSYLLSDSGARVLLTQTALSQKVNEITCLNADQVLFLDNHVTGHDASVAVHQGHAGPSNLAYVIYTSGSTGDPKGVLVTHGGVVNTITCVSARLPVSRQDRCLQSVSYCFDGSAVEIYSALLMSARLVLLPENRKEPRLFARYVTDQRVTVAMLLPAFLEMLKDQPLPGLQKIFTGGETVHPDVIHYPDKTYLNLYGPTETSIVATTEKFVGSRYQASIGRPISNTRIYLLDEHGQLVPIGAAGELCVSGDGVAKGYLNLPHLTSRSFVADPFLPGQSMYRTGDRARWLTDGRLEFLGRRDHQVKIRGFRVECGDIERNLSQFGNLDDVAVVAYQDSGGVRLIAYYVPDSQTTAIDGATLRRFLRERLPYYMVPSAFVPLEAMPLSAVGKVDRRALARRALKLPEQQSYAAPKTELEKELASIWSDVLGVKRVGLHDNFFELGGQSLMAIQIIARIQEERMGDLSLKNFFEYPTVEGLSQVLDLEGGFEEGEI